MLTRFLPGTSATPLGLLMKTMASKTFDVGGSLSQQPNNLQLDFCSCESNACFTSQSAFTNNYCSKTDHGQTKDGSTESSGKESGIVEWNKLSEDEKSIYQVHKVACQVNNKSRLNFCTAPYFIMHAVHC